MAVRIPWAFAGRYTRFIAYAAFRFVTLSLTDTFYDSFGVPGRPCFITRNTSLNEASQAPVNRRHKSAYRPDLWL